MAPFTYERSVGRDGLGLGYDGLPIDVSIPSRRTVVAQRHT